MDEFIWTKAAVAYEDAMRRRYPKRPHAEIRTWRAHWAAGVAAFFALFQDPPPDPDDGEPIDDPALEDLPDVA